MAELYLNFTSFLKLFQKSNVRLYMLAVQSVHTGCDYLQFWQSHRRSSFSNFPISNVPPRERVTNTWRLGYLRVVFIVVDLDGGLLKGTSIGNKSHRIHVLPVHNIDDDFLHLNVGDAVDHFTSMYSTHSTSTRYLISTLYFEGTSPTALFPRSNVMGRVLISHSMYGDGRDSYLDFTCHFDICLRCITTGCVTNQELT